jgi:hypothetical protein
MKISKGSLLFAVSLAGSALFTWLYVTGKPKGETDVGEPSKLVVKYLEPMGRSCIFDMKAYCVHHPSVTFDVSKFSYCQSYFWLPDGRSGHLEVYPRKITCRSDGKPPNGVKVIVKMDNNSYYAECIYTVSSDVVCQIKSE